MARWLSVRRLLEVAGLVVALVVVVVAWQFSGGDRPDQTTGSFTTSDKL